MPKPDYVFEAAVMVAAPGPSSGTVVDSLLGTRISRDGARLAFAEADARAWDKQLSPIYGDVDPHHVVLVDPSIAQVRAAIEECQAFLDQFGDHESWGGGELDFVFAGHGTTHGDLVLRDGKLTPDMIMEWSAKRTPASKKNRRLAFVLDSCYSGVTLAKLLTHEAHHREALIIDAFAAAMPDELAWEMEDLGHGVLTHTTTDHTPMVMGGGGDFALAIEVGDERAIRRNLWRAAPNPVSYLTEATQHSLDLINGHHLSIKGLGSVGIGGGAQAEQICETLIDLRNSPNPGSGNHRAVQ